MEVAKDTSKQEKRRMAVRGAGKGVGGMVVWGGVAVVAASILVASVSAFKSWRKNKEATRKADDLNKVNGEADTPSTENDTQPLEIIGKMREDKVDHVNEAPNKDEEKNTEEVTNGNIFQEHQLAKSQINDKEIEVEEEAILAIPKPMDVESVKVHGDIFGKDVVKKDEELAEEIEVDTPMSHGHEDESDENCSLDEIVEKQQEQDGDIVVEREERVVEKASRLNQFADESKFVAEKEYIHDEDKAENGGENSYLQQIEKQEGKRDGNESVHEETEENCEGKVILENEEESSETSEEDDGEEREESSEGTGDSSIEFNDDKIWPAEAMEDILIETKKSEIEHQILEENSDENVKVEKKQNSLKIDSNYVTNRCEIEDSGESVISYRKRNMKEFLLDLSSKRILIWALAVLVLALAAPLVLSPEGIVKLSLVTFFVVSVSRVLKTIL